MFGCLSAVKPVQSSFMCSLLTSRHLSAQKDSVRLCHTLDRCGLACDKFK